MEYRERFHKINTPKSVILPFQASHIPNKNLKAYMNFLPVAILTPVNFSGVSVSLARANSVIAFSEK